MGQSDDAAEAGLRGDSTCPAPVLDVSVAPPEGVLLALAVDDVFEAFVDEHDPPALRLGVLQFVQLILDRCERKKRFC